MNLTVPAKLKTMKKRITTFSISILLLFAAAGISAFDQQEKGKNKKEQQQNQGKGQGKNQDKKGNAGQGNDQPNKNNQGNNGQNGNQGNQGNNKDRGNNGNNGNNANARGNNELKERGNSGQKNRDVAMYGYNWDRETFRDRKKIRNQEKVTICHKVNRSGEPGVSITVSANALKAHLDHGDARGDCPEVDNTGFSNIFLERRRDYYNVLQSGQEQVIYSRSILDYALERLSGARLQLVTLQQANAPQAEIDTRRVAVVELEQNVSTLEILLGAAANILANKLQ
jgi:hypothetical protein